MNIREQKQINEQQFGRRNMYQDVNGNRKLFWKEVTKGNAESRECSIRIKGENEITVELLK